MLTPTDLRAFLDAQLYKPEYPDIL